MYEGTPLALLEAFAEGTCVIATDAGGMKEIIKSGYNGCLIPKNKVEVLAKQMEFFVNNKEIRNELAKNAYCSAQKYNWKNRAEELVEFYQEIIEDNHKND